jgi:formate dehydrogenase assembly factor FdhD
VLKEHRLDICVKREDEAGPVKEVSLLCINDSLEDLIRGYLYTSGLTEVPEDVVSMSLEGGDGGTKAEVVLKGGEQSAGGPEGQSACARPQSAAGDGVQNAGDSGEQSEVQCAGGGPGTAGRPAVLPEVQCAGGRSGTAGRPATLPEVQCAGGGSGTAGRPATLPEVQWRLADVIQAQKIFRDAPPLFEATGMVHRCIILTKGKESVDITAAEDLGRHNAIDKAVGAALRKGTDLAASCLFTSGRMPSDMTMKVIMAGIPVFMSRSAPTDKSIELARKYHLNMIGFIKKDRCTIYTDFRQEENGID